MGFKQKLILSKLLDYTKLPDALLVLQKVIWDQSFIRAVNYHSTPAIYAFNFEKQLDFFSHHFSNCSFDDLEVFFREKKWKKNKPGLIISFDDGLKNNYDVALPLLEKYGFSGWFFVPPGFINCPEKDQHNYAIIHNIFSDDLFGYQKVSKNPFYRDSSSIDDRLAMNWNELQDLKKRGHIIGCHTMTHHRTIREDTDDLKLHEEIVQSKVMLENQLENKVPIFAWVGGEENTYTAEASKIIALAGYQYSFMTIAALIFPDTCKLQLQRTNIEVDQPLHIVKFQISGLMDIFRAKKRRRIENETAL